MPIRPPEFDRLAERIAPALLGLPGLVIAVTGAMGSGKTTFARFLCWYFNVSLIETDHYLKHNAGLQYESSEVARIVSLRLAIPRPVIVDGVGALELLESIGRFPDIVVEVRNRNVGECPPGVAALGSTFRQTKRAPVQTLTLDVAH